MSIQAEQTVRDIALQNPATVKVFESYGIDYCCGGRKPLKEACAQAGIPVEGLIESLSTAGETETGVLGRWNDAPLSNLAAHIVATHHAYVREESPRLSALAEKVASRHGANHPELAQIRDIFQALTQELSTHMMKEENLLFPYITALDTGTTPCACFATVQAPISVMVADHEDAGGLLEEMRSLSNGYTAPADGCPSYRGLYHGLQEFERDLHRHVHLENNILFPRAIALEQKLAACVSA